MIRRCVGALLAVLLCAGVAGCQQQAEKVATRSLDVAQALELIAESAGSDQVQRVSASFSAGEVRAYMIVGEELSVWWWNGTGEPTVEDTEPGDYDSWPRTPTDTDTMAQAVLALPSCYRGQVTAEALSAEAVQVEQQFCGGEDGGSTHRTYVGGTEITTESLDLTDPDRLAAAVEQSLAVLDDRAITRVQVELGEEPELRVWLAEPLPVLAGDDGTCPAYLRRGLGMLEQPQLLFHCGWEQETPAEVREPFVAEVALEAYERAAGAEELTYLQRWDMPVYEVTTGGGRYWFDTEGTPLLGDGLVGTTFEPGAYTTVDEVSGECTWTITTEQDGERDTRESETAGTGRPEVTLSDGEQFTSTGCGPWRLV